MGRSLLTKALFAGSSAAAIALTASSAMAGGFSSRQQSVTGQGFSYAGAGTSVFGIGSMFWNPANITNFEGRRSEWNFTLVAPDTSVTTSSLVSASGKTNFLAVGVPGIGSGNINQGTLTTASYNSYQLNNMVWLGLQTGTPFGSRTKTENGFAGSMFGSSTVIRAVAITPTIGIKLNDWFSFGFGVTVQQLNGTLSSRSPSALIPIPGARLKGDAYGVGWTAGATIKPMIGTEISLGYRSSIRHSLEGELDTTFQNGVFRSSNLIKANMNLPDIATLGISQRITDRWTATGTLQWTNWSRLKTIPIVDRTTGLPLQGSSFRYKDEWFVALGAQYQLNDAWKLRAGVAFEKSPIDDENRAVRVLDSDRIWLSLGAGYKWSEKLEMDFSYSHIFLKNGQVNIVPPGSPLNPVGNPAYTAGFPQFSGRSKGSIDIVGFSLKYRWDDPAPSSAPIVKKF
jgi:long-chain fatty acid transport protein